MPVEKTQKITLLNYPEAGVNTNLDPSIQVQGETTLRVSCDSSTCKNSVSWVIENAGNTAENVPDDAFRVLILEDFLGKKSVYCSWDCLRRAMKSYIPPLSPREQAEIDAHNATLTPTVPATVQNTEAVSQPDGFAETT